MRQGFGGGIPGGHLAELLRTLGQELDRDGVDVSGIVQQEAGFLVSGTIEGRYTRKLYGNEELRELSEARRTARSLSTSTDGAADAPVGSALLGAPVITADEQHVGKVKEVRGQFFRVDAGFLQRDFWLSADCVVSAIPGEQVLLEISKASLNQHKRHNPPVGE